MPVGWCVQVGSWEHVQGACENRLHVDLDGGGAARMAAGGCLRAGVGRGGDAFHGSWTPWLCGTGRPRVSPVVGGGHDRGEHPPDRDGFRLPPQRRRPGSRHSLNRSEERGRRDVPRVRDDGRGRHGGDVPGGGVESARDGAALGSAAPVAWARCPNAPPWSRALVAMRSPSRRMALSPIEVCVLRT